MKNIFKKPHIGTSHDPNRSNEIPASSSVASPSCSTDHRTVSIQNSGASPPSPSPSSSPSTTAVPSSPATAVANRQNYFSSEEKFQVQLALAISASNSDDPEKDQIRAATLLSLRGHRIESTRNEDGVAEALSRQYWEYNVLDYEEKVVDGFYDVYGLYTDSAMQGKMPSLTDLEAKSGSSGFEVVIVNRTIDPALEELVQIAVYCIRLPSH